MCAVDLTEVYSPALFNERSMMTHRSSGVAADLETVWNLELDHDETNAAMSCEAQDRKS